MRKSIVVLAFAAVLPSALSAQQPVPLGTSVDSVRPARRVRPAPPTVQARPRERTIAPGQVQGARGTARVAPQVPARARLEAVVRARRAQRMSGQPPVPPTPPQPGRAMRAPRPPQAPMPPQAARAPQLRERLLQERAMRAQPVPRQGDRDALIDRLPQMREQLNLTDDQVRRMRDMTERMQKNRDEIAEKMRRNQEEMRKSEEDMRRQMMELLTPEQRRQLEQRRGGGGSN